MRAGELKPKERWRKEGPQHRAMQDFGDAMAELKNCIESLGNKGENRKDREIRSTGRQIAVALRKLLFDRANEPIVLRVLERTRFHQLKGVKEGHPMNMEADLKVSYVEGGQKIWTTEGKSNTRMESLPGWRREGILCEVDTEIFEEGETPRMELKEWLDQEMIEIIGRKTKTYTLKSLLKYVADTEGAHADTGSEDRSGKRRDGGKLEGLGSGRTWLYVHFISIACGMYILNRYCEEAKGAKWEKWQEKDVIPETGTRGRWRMEGTINPSWTTEVRWLEGVNLREPKSTTPPEEQAEHEYVVRSAVGGRGKA